MGDFFKTLMSQEVYFINLGAVENNVDPVYSFSPLGERETLGANLAKQKVKS